MLKKINKYYIPVAERKKVEPKTDVIIPIEPITTDTLIPEENDPDRLIKIQKILDQNKIDLAPLDPPKIIKRGRKSTSEEQRLIMERAKTMPLEPLLKDTIKIIPFGALAAYTGYEGFNCTDEEAASFAKLADECIRIYMPNLAGKWTPLCILAGTMTASILVKYQHYKKDQNKTVEKIDEV